MRSAVLVISMLLAGAAQALPLMRYVAVSLVIDGVEYNYSGEVEQWSGVLYKNPYVYIDETTSNGVPVKVWQSGGEMNVRCGSSDAYTYQSATTWNVGPLGPASNVIVTWSGFSFTRLVNQTTATIEFRPDTLSRLAQTLPPGIGATTNAYYRFSWSVTSGSSQGIKLYSLSSGAVVSSAPDMEYGFLVGEFAFRRDAQSRGFDVLYGSDDVPIYGKDDDPLYAGKPFIYTTNVTVMTEWAFDQSAYGSPVAYINGESVCGGHSTSHIIDYTVTSADSWTWNKNKQAYEAWFTMSIYTSGSGGSCNFRCWRNASSYDAANVDERASVSGDQSTVARFRIEHKPQTGEIHIVAD